MAESLRHASHLWMLTKGVLHCVGIAIGKLAHQGVVRFQQRRPAGGAKQAQIDRPKYEFGL